MSTNTQETFNSHGFSLHVDITIAPENVNKFFEAFRPTYELVTAEPECTYFELFHEADNPGHFRIVESWSKSKEWFFAEQLKKPYYKDYEKLMESLWTKPREFKIYDRLAPKWTRYAFCV